jgi:hypothetical protein
MGSKTITRFAVKTPNLMKYWTRGKGTTENIWEAKLYDVKPHTLNPVVMVSVTYEEKPYEVE